MVRERVEDYVQWEKRHRGLCRNEYFVGVPAQRTVSEVYNETTFRLEPERIKVCIVSDVRSAVRTFVLIACCACSCWQSQRCPLIGVGWQSHPLCGMSSPSAITGTVVEPVFQPSPLQESFSRMRSWACVVLQHPGSVHLSFFHRHLHACMAQEHFMAQVEGRVSASTTYVRAFVHQYVAGRINEARRSIESYAQQYSQTMEDALNVHREGGTPLPPNLLS